MNKINLLPSISRGHFYMNQFMFFVAIVGMFMPSACRLTNNIISPAENNEAQVFESAFENRAPLIPAWSKTKGNCRSLLTEATFKNLLTFLEKEANKTKRLNYSKEVLDSSCITSYLIARIAKLFDLESDKLSIAKYGYSKVYDPQNYHWILDQLMLLNSQEEMNKLIETKLE